MGPPPVHQQPTQRFQPVHVVGRHLRVHHGPFRRTSIVRSGLYTASIESCTSQAAPPDRLAATIDGSNRQDDSQPCCARTGGGSGESCRREATNPTMRHDHNHNQLTLISISLYHWDHLGVGIVSSSGARTASRSARISSSIVATCSNSAIIAVFCRYAARTGGSRDRFARVGSATCLR